MKTFKSITIIALSCILFACGSSDKTEPVQPVTEENLTTFDAWISELEQNQQISASILFSHQGDILYERAIGKVHPDKDDNITLSSSFNLASVSKQFTAMGIMLLENQGKLSFDLPVQVYLEEFTYPDITVRHLLNHTSGIADYMALVENHWQGDMFTNNDLLTLFSEQQPELAFLPGEKFEYSNTGYVLLSAIIERISEQSFENFLQQQIFVPLEMTHSRVVNLLSEPNMLPTRVYGQHGEELNDLTVLDGVTGDGAVYSSAKDLLIWHNSLTQNSLLPQDKLLNAFTPAQLNDGSLSYYGFGWGLDQDTPAEKMSHSGGWVGFRTIIYREVNQDTVIIILTNNTGGVSFSALYNRFANSIKDYVTP